MLEQLNDDELVQVISDTQEKLRLALNERALRGSKPVAAPQSGLLGFMQRLAADQAKKQSKHLFLGVALVVCYLGLLILKAVK